MRIIFICNANKQIFLEPLFFVLDIFYSRFISELAPWEQITLNIHIKSWNVIELEFTQLIQIFFFMFMYCTTLIDIKSTRFFFHGKENLYLEVHCMIRKKYHPESKYLDWNFIYSVDSSSSTTPLTLFHSLFDFQRLFSLFCLIFIIHCGQSFDAAVHNFGV